MRLPPTIALASTSSNLIERFLTSISNDFLMASILTTRSCSSWSNSVVCLISTLNYDKELYQTINVNEKKLRYLDALVTLIGDAQFLSDLIVISSDSGQLLFDLALNRSEINVDGGQFVDARDTFLILLFDGSLTTQGLPQ